MNILLVTTSYPLDSIDMTGIFIKRLAMSMQNEGSQVTVLAPGDSHSKSSEIENGIKIIRFWYAPRNFMKIAYGSGGIPENISNFPWLWIVIPFFLLSMVIHIIKHSRGCDIIHANWLYTGLMAIPASFFRKIVLVTTLRGSDLKKQKSKIFKLLIIFSDAVTVVSKNMSEQLKKKFSEEIFYTPNGVQAIDQSIDIQKKFGIAKDKITVLFVGSLCERKGIDILVKVAERITDPSICFLVVGPGKPNDYHLDQFSNIIYAGKLEPDETLSIYSSCDIYFLPSRHEGRPNSLLEAMSSSLPSIVSPLPGVVDFFTDECGVILKNTNLDPEYIAKTIILLAQDSSLRKKMGTAAKKRIFELSLNWHSCAKTYHSIFGECLNVRHRRYH